MTAAAPGVGDKGLKAGAIGYLTNIVIGVASTAPAYSLAATLGFVTAVGGMGVHAPAVLIAAFVPILFVSLGYKYLNKADPDCGTTFAWTTRAFGPWVGWINGWAIFVADVIVMASLSVIASQYTCRLFNWDAGANSTGVTVIGSVLWIALMTWICYRGIELSARIQQILLAAEIIILFIFSIVAFAKASSGTLGGSIEPRLDWFNPFALSLNALAVGVLLGIFIYWGWDSGVAVNEESESSADGPGRAAVISTLLLLVTYVLVATAAQAFAGPAFLTNNSGDVLNALGGKVLGSGWDKFLIIAVLTSASASTQTTILPTARTTLSMARWGAIPEGFGRVHKRFLTPTWSTLGMGALSAVWTALLVGFDGGPNGNVLGDSISALGFAVCFYYGFTGLCCAWYYRRDLFKSVRLFVLVGLVPLAGGGLMFAVFARAFDYYNNGANNYAKPFLGIQIPLLIGVGGLLLGVPFMVLCFFKFHPFFSRKTEIAPEGVLDS
jgi:amino acid transporter